MEGPVQGFGREWWLYVQDCSCWEEGVLSRSTAQEQEDCHSALLGHGTGSGWVFGKWHECCFAPSLFLVLLEEKEVVIDTVLST